MREKQNSVVKEYFTTEHIREMADRIDGFAAEGLLEEFVTDYILERMARDGSPMRTFHGTLGSIKAVVFRDDSNNEPKNQE